MAFLRQTKLHHLDQQLRFRNRLSLVQEDYQEIIQSEFNLAFVPSLPFLYPLKTSENRKVFWCFQGVEKGCIGNEWVK